ncbi:hypothetical protein [Actinokineospora sp. NBRC 105648]|uniref:hypothetical protein n=1 Tax=Actinokineospora sp. NBRC 105648 TaxID=3032206 RepID=UPI0024A1DC6D|nr:hypothetical protein [Actinokineospora sp. NBRC 105648]GLZ38964.1 hypothetical protein Acsp05_25880 [Actinokineospora sp. NBRC 105648]
MGTTGTYGGSDDDARPTAPQPPKDRFADDLIGLDPADPEAKAFAEHLDRVEQVAPSYTVEGYLGQVRDFAESANRLGGHHRLTAGILAALILLGVVVAAWDALVFIVGVLFG